MAFNNKNSAKPTTAEIVGGVYNATPPVLSDGDAAALQLDVNGKLITSGGGSGTSDTNITEVAGVTVAATPAAALPVELFDGTNPIGTAGNPLSVNVITGGGTNASVGATGAAAPTSATEMGIIVGANLQGVSASNPVPISAASLPLPALAATSTKQSDGSQKTQIVDGSGNVIGATSNALDVNIKSGITNPLPVSLAAETTKVIGTVRATGNVGGVFDAATAATAPANAIQAGMRGSTTVPTAVTDGQLVGARSDKYGNQIAVLNAPRDLIGTSMLNSSSGSTVSFIAAGASGVFNDIITLIITNESSTATIVSLSDNGAGGTVYKFALAANGGIVINFPTPLPQGTSAAAWQIFNSAAVACDYVAVYAKNK